MIVYSSCLLIGFFLVDIDFIPSSIFLQFSQLFDNILLQIFFAGFNGGQALAVDDVSFTKEPCNQIPWKQNEGSVNTRRCIMTGCLNHWPYSSITSVIRQVCLSVFFFFFFFIIIIII